MPFEMVREGIETNMKQKWRKLKEHIERMEKENKENNRMSSPEDEVIPRGKEEESGSLRKEISRLKNKVKTYKELAEQQEQVLQVGRRKGWCYHVILGSSSTSLDFIFFFFFFFLQILVYPMCKIFMTE